MKAGLGVQLVPGFYGRLDTVIDNEETSLLRRLQAQTLPDATSPIDKISPFSKMAVTV